MSTGKMEYKPPAWSCDPSVGNPDTYHYIMIVFFSELFLTFTFGVLKLSTPFSSFDVNRCERIAPLK
jgi:hypothetical protein